MTPAPTYLTNVAAEDSAVSTQDGPSHPAEEIENGTRNSSSDTDQIMDNAPGIGEQNSPPRNQPNRPSGGNGTPSGRFTLRIPSQINYANALKRTVDQVGDTDDNGDGSRPDQEVPVETAPRWPQKPVPGPIKGFNATRVFENLDYQVKESWKRQAKEAVFVHYLGGGYNPTVAQNVHTIGEDLKSKHTA